MNYSSISPISSALGLDIVLIRERLANKLLSQWFSDVKFEQPVCNYHESVEESLATRSVIRRMSSHQQLSEQSRVCGCVLL